MSKFSYLIILIIFSYVILCSQAFIFADALTPVTLLSISLSFTYFLISFKHKIFRILLIFQILVNLFYVFTYENDIQISGINKSRIHSHKEVIEIINDNYSDGDMLVSSLHPIYGYYLNQNWIMTPQNNINLCDMVRLNINEKIFNYAPKIEISPITNESKLNFIILTSEHILNWDFVNDDLEINADLVCSDQVTSIFNNGHVNLLKVF